MSFEASKAGRSALKRIESSFESLLANSRYLTLVAVVASLASAAGAFYMASVDVFYALKNLASYASAEFTMAERVALRSETITSIIKAVDGYLLAAVMIIFSLGLYELFVSRIDRLEDTSFSSRVLVIHSLDELKDKLSRVILLILVVKFLQVALSAKYAQPLEVVYLALGIVLVGLALFVGNLHLRRGGSSKDY